MSTLIDWLASSPDATCSWSVLRSYPGEVGYRRNESDFLEVKYIYLLRLASRWLVGSCELFFRQDCLRSGYSKGASCKDNVTRTSLMTSQMILTHLVPTIRNRFEPMWSTCIGMSRYKAKYSCKVYYLHISCQLYSDSFCVVIALLASVPGKTMAVKRSVVQPIREHAVCR